MWLTSIKAELKPASYKRRCVAVAGLASQLKGKNARSIAYADVEQWRRKRGAVLSARSFNIELETLNLLLRYACERGVLLDNIADKFKRRKQIQAIVRILTRDQFSALVKSMRDSAKAVAAGTVNMVEFLAYSGMRIGEAREVRWRDINFERNTILVTGGELGPKNLRQRSTPLFPSLRNLLARMKRANFIEDPNHKLFSIKSPYNALNAACERIGMERFTVHSLRHFFASEAIEEGINFKTVADWLGHSDGGVLVAKTYGHLRPEFGAIMAERMTFEAKPLVEESLEAK